MGLGGGQRENKGERWYQGKQQRRRGNNSQDWMLTVSGNQEKANINKEVSNDA